MLFRSPTLFGQLYESSARMLLSDTYISLFRRMLSSLKKFFIRYKRSSKVLFLKGGMHITIGILRVKVASKAEEGSSVVAQIINQLRFLRGLGNLFL